MTVRVETVRSEGFTLAAMIWLMLRRQPRGYLEQVYAHNQNLAQLGPILPVGTRVEFPLDNIPTEDEPAVNVVRLWD